MTEAAPRLVGHDAALGEIADAFASGRMHHAWLICGIEGIGKASVAKCVARYVLSGGRGEIAMPDPSDRVASLVDAESHPDLLVVRRPVDEKTGEQKASIPVDETLKVASFLHKTATHGGWRVVILDEAHALTRNGQNAILKIVEEPPPRTLILITVTTPGALLPTIRSRCRVLQLAPLADEAMRAVLQQIAPKEAMDDLDPLVILSGGSVGFALKIVRTGTLPLYQEMLAILDMMPDLDTARLHKLADQIARKADAEGFDVLSTLLVERLRRAAHEEAAKGAQGHIELTLKLWEKTRATLAAVSYANLDRKLGFINAMNDIRAAVAAQA